MNAKSRLSAEERKQSIIEAAIPLFAKKGFNGTTTRELAEAAGISEALMYKHFPSKKEMYLYIQDYCCSEKADDLEKLSLLPANTESLVFCVVFFINRVIKADHASQDMVKSFNRLMTNSLLEDGEFAK